MIERLMQPPVAGFEMPTAEHFVEDNPYQDKVQLDLPDDQRPQGNLRQRVRLLNIYNEIRKDIWEFYRQLAVIEAIPDPDEEILKTRSVIRQQIYLKRGKLGTTRNQLLESLKEEEDRVQRRQNLEDKWGAEICCIVEQFKPDIGTDDIGTIHTPAARALERSRDPKEPLHIPEFTTRHVIIQPDLNQVNSIVKQELGI